jgi:hypothetical protein
MIEVPCEVLKTFRDSNGESFVRVRQLDDLSWYCGDAAELGGCPLAAEVPWVENPWEPENFAPFVYEFHLIRRDDIDRFVPGSEVIFKPGIPRFRR